MADTTFTDNETVIPAAWANDVNDCIYTYLGATAGTGAITKVQFPATQSASADANALDDYEEGTWTPTISSTSGTITTASASGTYTKIGDRWLYEVVITVTDNGTGSGNLRYTLPVTMGQQHVPVGVNTSSAATIAGQSTTSVVDLAKYDGTYPVSSGHTVRVSGSCK